MALLASHTDAYLSNPGVSGLHAPFVVPPVPGPIVPGPGGGGGGGMVRAMLAGGGDGITGRIGAAPVAGTPWVTSIDTGLAFGGFPDVCYGNGMYAALLTAGADPPRVYRSADLVTWNWAGLGPFQDPGGPHAFTRALYWSTAKAQYYCYCSDFAPFWWARVLYSADLITWNRAANPIQGGALVACRFLFVTNAGTLLGCMASAPFDSVRRSINDGGAWANAVFAANIQNSAMMGQAPGGNIYLLGTLGGPVLRQSVDDGQNFTAVATVAWGGMTQANYFTVTPAGTLLASQAGQIYRSVDGGINWTAAVMPAVVVITRIRSENGGVIWALGASALGTVLLTSVDEGANWTQVFDGAMLAGAVPEGVGAIGSALEYER